jgi:hypothetical protein
VYIALFCLIATESAEMLMLDRIIANKRRITCSFCSKYTYIASRYYIFEIKRQIRNLSKLAEEFVAYTSVRHKIVHRTAE